MTPLRRWLCWLLCALLGLGAQFARPVVSDCEVAARGELKTACCGDVVVLPAAATCGCCCAAPDAGSDCRCDHDDERRPPPQPEAPPLVGKTLLLPPGTAPPPQRAAPPRAAASRIDPVRASELPAGPLPRRSRQEALSVWRL